MTTRNSTLTASPDRTREGMACPLCGRAIDPLVFQFYPTLEPRIARRLQGRHPGWQPADGACPACVAEAVDDLLAQRSLTSLHREWNLPFPVYAPDQTDLLPTPLRVRANPNLTGEGVTIAFLDSGFYPHPDFTRPKNRILVHVDATAGEPVERPRFKQRRRTSWHGLMTAGVGAGNGFMSGGAFRGVAHRARLVLVRTGSRRGRGIRERDIHRALTWVIAHRERYDIRVVNISLGGDQPSPDKLTELDDLVERAVAAGMVVVAAGGNGGARRVVPPASAPSAITVGGLDDQNSLDPRHRRMFHSNYGTGAYGVAKPDLIAPAIWLAAPMLPRTWVHNEAQFLFQLDRASDEELARILQSDFAERRFKQSTLRRPLPEVRRVIRDRMVEQKFIHPHYQHVDGTSMAAPIVSAVAAQMLEANPSLSPAQVKERLRTTAEPLADAPPEQQGCGALNAARAAAAALRAPGGPMDGFPISPLMTAEYVTFYYHAPRAQAVAVVGSFNAWRPQPMSQILPGVWRLSIPPVLPGAHRYKFIVDGRRWVNDPENAAIIEDGFGGFNSLLEA